MIRIWLNSILKIENSPFQIRYTLKMVFFILVLFSLSCDDSSKTEKQILAIDVGLNIERFDKLFASSNPTELPSLKQKYPFLFSSRFSDSIWINRMKDPIQSLLNNAVDSVFNDFKQTESEINLFYQHLKYYNKSFSIPRVITVLSDVDYRNKVVVTDTIVLIALDTYLGKDHEFYTSFYEYKKQNLNPTQIVPDLASSYAEQFIYQPKKTTFLDQMIYFGKQLYLKDLWIPFKTNSEKIGYSESQYKWSESNEFYVWQYFIENELLYLTDRKLLDRFILSAPFSQFNLELDRESPGRIGQYIGWQIIKSYMENNSTTYLDMLLMDPQDIFNNAKFKPKK